MNNQSKSKHVNSTTPNRKTTYIFAIEVKQANPGGDPDCDNRPRVDPYSGRGTISPQNMARAVRDRGALLFDWPLHIKAGSVLNHNIEAAADRAVAEYSNKTQEHKKMVDAEMAKTYFDVRAFGGVLGTGNKPGTQLQRAFGFATALSIGELPIVEVVNTRCAVTSEKEAERNDVNQTMGRRYVVPYAVYVGTCTLTIPTAEKNGVTTKDQEEFEEALATAWEDMNSDAKSGVSMAKMLKLEYPGRLGGRGMTQSKVERLLKVVPSMDVPQSFDDFEVTVGDIPDGFTLTDIV